MAENQRKISELKIKRRQMKAAVTRFATFINSINQANMEELINGLELRKVKFEDTLNQFNSIQTDLELLDESELSNNERDDFEDSFYENVSKANKLIADYVSKNRVVVTEESAAQLTSNMSKIRLPKIDLPRFGGSYEEWYNFHDTFQSLIHSNRSISCIEKFNYLKSALVGQAAEVIQSLEITAQNYESAWELLRERFDNKRLIIQKHVRAIYELPSTHKENYAILRQILDGALKHIRALKSLGRPTQYWDDLIIHIITTKLDSYTNKAWEMQLPKDSIPTLNDLTSFLTHRCQILENLSKTGTNQQIINSKGFAPNKSTAHVATSYSSCAFCSKGHSIYRCDKFLNLPANQRLTETKSKRLCTNCLKSKHSVSECKSKISCQKCNKRHNTLLHLNDMPSDQPTHVSTSNTASNIYQSEYQQVLLSTAMIKIEDVDGQQHDCRALLDSGSQSCFVTRDLVKRLRLKHIPTNISVGGINQATTYINEAVNVKISSRLNACQFNVDCFILDRITSNLPTFTFNKTAIQIPKNITLADPDFNISNTIDILIGAEIFFKLLCVGQIKSGKNQPYFHKTQLGWIISGVLHSNKPSHSVCNLTINQNTLQDNLHKFWELEEYTSKPTYSPEEKECENIFKNTFRRNEEGRFIVTLPLKLDLIGTMGTSREQAIRRFYSLERKLNKNPKLMDNYSKFIQEYQDLGHMKLSSISNTSNNLPVFYLPHHAVFKENSLTTKLRVVFDGSAKSSSGVSLNDVLMTGPTIQQDLVTIILRFRTHKIVLTADIAKMYRQVLVDESQTQLQRILWRFNPDEEIKSYDLTTVTYGTSSASYLAIRALYQLVEEEGHDYPVAAAIAKQDFYVDDLLTGSNTVQHTKTIVHEIKTLLNKGGFDLRKWISNHPEIFSNMPDNDVEHNILDLNKSESVSTLGLQWNSRKDTFQFLIKPANENSRVTKRTILSNTAQIFDPLGLLSPVIITAKILMQRLWKLNLTWDESVPIDIYTSWIQYKNQLAILNSLEIPRYIFENPQIAVELHGFCDASEAAYGACIYARSINEHHYTVRLICSKSRVAPVKVISIPRLELCGALLLARLLRKTIDAINMQVSNIYCWTDSTIALSWIMANARTWKTFVANRVSEIHDLTNPSDWHHVRTYDNPADLISRGSLPSDLITCKLWWNGPDWLSQETDKWPTLVPDSNLSDIPEIRTAVITAAPSQITYDVFERFSSMKRLIRVIAYCLRFASNIKCKIRKLNNPSTSTLSLKELTCSTISIIKRVQQECFQQEINDLSNSNTVPKRSKLLSLTPFLDENGLVRVGGRLRNASLDYNQKHPILLPKGHHVTTLIIREEHLNNYHCGVQGTLAAVRMTYWPLNARNTIKAIIQKCVTCFKAKPLSSQPIMGNLPTNRLTQARPFTSCGVDYFGPIMVREGKRKNSKYSKAYGALFICFATKAVHVEIASDLSAENFINVLKRFIARRGKPLHIYSDNATNFTGANKELSKLQDIFSEENKERIISSAAHQGIDWHFIPSRSPHFGGIWEAAVKSFKHHIKRIVGQASLRYEETYTLLTQIEAILNSRPLTPVSDDPNDLSFITPGHFLIGDSLTGVNDPNIQSLPLNTLSRWQHVERLRQHFWSRWSKEYLNQLQQRFKWKTTSRELQQGQLVLLIENNTPPLEWPIARVRHLHPGLDGITRTATVQTSKGIYKRAATKLCPFPIDNSDVQV